MSVQSSPGDAPHQRIRQRGAAPEIPAQAGHRRMGGLLWPDRAQPRLRPGQHAHARQAGGRWLPAQGRQDVDHQQPHRRRVCGVGQADRPRRQGRRPGEHPRLHPRKRHEGPERAQDRRQDEPARQHHRRDRDGRRVCARGQPAAQRERPEGPVRLPEQGPLRHRLGRPGRAEDCWHRARQYTWTACSLAARWRRTSSSRRSWPTCRPRSRWACRAACAWAA
jgi:hypothetical protein